MLRGVGGGGFGDPGLIGGREKALKDEEGRLVMVD